MNRPHWWKVLIVAFLCALAVMAGVGIVLAGTNLASLTTSTASDFQDASLTNLTIIGDTVKQGTTEGSTADAPSSNSFNSGSSTAGVIINPNEDLGGLEVELYSSNPDEVRIVRHSDGQVLATNSSVPDTTAKIGVNLEAGTEYRVIVEHPTQELWNDNPSYPITSDDVDIVNGYNGGEDPDNLWEVDAVSAFVGQVHNESEYINTYDVDDPVNASINITNLQNIEIQAEWQRNNGGTWETVASETITSTGVHEVDLSGTSDDQWRIKWQGNVTGGGWFDRVAVMESESFEFENTAPAVNNTTASPSGGDVITASEVTLEIDVSDEDFDSAQGDEVSVEFFVNGTSEGTDTLTSNGTASITYEEKTGGDREWFARATDSYGGETDSDTFIFETPDRITFRNESNASEVVTGASVTATFYSVDGTSIIQKTDDDGDGNISLSGLPVGDEFVLVAEADGWYDQRIYIQSIFEQDNVYLLNETSVPDPADTTFIYEDRTGDFPSDDTTLQVQRAVDPDGDGNFTWETVAGDFWGAAGEFPHTGEPNARYRLIIQNEEGTERNLGTHIPTGDSTKNVVIGTLEWPQLNGTARNFDAELNQSTNEILTTYFDPEDDTTEIRIAVWEYGNESNEIYNETFSNGPYGTLNVAIAGLTDEQANMSWTVQLTATTGDGEVTFSIPVGGAETDLGIDPWLLGKLVWFGLIFVASLYGPRTATIGAWTLCLAAGMVMIFGWVNIPFGAFIAATAIATGGTLYKEAIP